MNRNVTSLQAAINKGYDIRLYTYDPDKIPLGEFDAILDFKTWSKRIFAINCYFTKIDTGTKFVVTVYCNFKTGRYEVPGSGVNFSECVGASHYRIDVERSAIGRIVLVKGEVAQF